MKKSTLKRTLSALTTVMLAFSTTACAQSSSSTASSDAPVSTTAEEKLYYNKTDLPICDEPITIKVTGQQGNTKNWNNTLVVKTIEEKMGIKLDCEPVPNDMWATQYSLMLTSDQMPDLFINATTDKSQVNKDGASGKFLDISQYLDLMPNYTAFMEENPNYTAYTKADGGAIYGINRLTPGNLANANVPIWYHKDILKDTGVSEIKTTEDFYNVLKAIKEKDSSMIPLAATFDAVPAQRVDQILRAAFGVYSWENSYMLIPDQDDKLSLGDISDNNREYLTYMNRLWDEDLLDHDAFIISRDEYRAKVQSGKVAFFSDFGGLPAAVGTDKTLAQQQEYEFLVGLKSDSVDKLTYVFNSGILANARIFVNAKTEYPEAICRLIDYAASEEGQVLFTDGIEGVSFDYVDDGFGNKVVNDPKSYEKYYDSKNYQSVSDWKNQTVVINQAMNLTWNTNPLLIDKATDADLQKYISDPNFTYTYNARFRVALNEQVDEEYTGLVPMSYTTEESTERATIFTDLNNYLVTMKSQFIRGEVDVNDDAKWNEYVSKVNEMGLEALLKIEQTAYDRYLSNLK